MADRNDLGMRRRVTSADAGIKPLADNILSENDNRPHRNLSRRLRQAGLRTELYPEAKGLGKQLKYADRKGFPLAIIGGPDELEKGVWQVKDLRDGSSEEVADGDLVDNLQAKL